MIPPKILNVSRPIPNAVNMDNPAMAEVTSTNQTINILRTAISCRLILDSSGIWDSITVHITGLITASMATE